MFAGHQYSEAVLHKHMKKHLARCSNNGVRKVEFASLCEGEDGEYSGVGFVEIYNIFLTHGEFFFSQ